MKRENWVCCKMLTLWPQSNSNLRETWVVGSGCGRWWLYRCVWDPHAGGPPAPVGAIAGVYGWVYGIHSILWHLHKKYMYTLGKVSVPSKKIFFNQTTYQASMWHLQIVSHLSPSSWFYCPLPWGWGWPWLSLRFRSRDSWPWLLRRPWVTLPSGAFNFSTVNREWWNLSLRCLFLFLLKYTSHTLTISKWTIQ